MRAFKIECGDDDHGSCVVFSESAAKARGRDSRDCDCGFLSIRVRRAKEFDEYAPGPVTIEQYLQHGWHWTCSGCEKHIYSDEVGRVLCGEHRVFCSRDCLAKELQRTKEWTDGKQCHESMAIYVAEMEESLNHRVAKESRA